MYPILQKEDSWNLSFCWHASGATNCNVPHGLEEVPHLVAQECKGVPLVLKVIGGTMFGEIDVEQWKVQHKILKHSCNINKNVDVQLFEVLNYEDLESHLKVFFYFAKYLKDHRVWVLKLIGYWEGEGLVPKDKIGDPSADACSLLRALIK
jgi:disease resistance protein RPS2